MRLSAPLLVSLLLLTASSAPAKADFRQLFDPIEVELDDINKIVLGVPLDHALEARGKKRASTRTRGDADVVKTVAARLPSNKRKQGRELYAAFLSGFAKIEDQFDLSPGDLVGPTSLFVIASIEAYHGTSADAASIRRVLEQVRSALRSSRALGRAKSKQKRRAYEALVLAGMGVATASASLEKGGNAEQIRPIIRRVFSTVLSVDIEDVRITTRGIEIDAAPSKVPKAASKTKPAQIAGGLFSWKMKSGYFGASTTLQHKIIKRTYLLLKDKTCTTRLPKSLGAFDVAAHRRENPKSWCKWRKRKGKIEVAMRGGKFVRPPNQTLLTAAKKREKLEGTWTRYADGEIGDNSWARHKAITLSRNGTFKFKGFSGHWGKVGDRGRVVSSNTDKLAGTYSLDGFVADIELGDGTVENRLFLASRDRDFMLFRGAIYKRKTKKNKKRR